MKTKSANVKSKQPGPAAWLVSLFTLPLLLSIGACSFETRSQAFACPLGNECLEGRVCSDGWCVVEPFDAGNVAIDSAICPPSCSSCSQGTCMILCETVDSCAQVVVCPPNMPCLVQCEGVDSCAAGIDCSDASSCELGCAGVGSCEGVLACGAGACTIACTGIESCVAGADCRDACSCDVQCADGCGVNQCPGNSACVKDELCSSSPGSCRNCQ